MKDMKEKNKMKLIAFAGKIKINNEQRNKLHNTNITGKKNNSGYPIPLVNEFEKIPEKTYFYIF
jgi:hypothetical protein